MTIIRIPIYKTRLVNDCIEAENIKYSDNENYSEPLSEEKIREAMHRREKEERELFDEIPAF